MDFPSLKTRFCQVLATAFLASTFSLAGCAPSEVETIDIPPDMPKPGMDGGEAPTKGRPGAVGKSIKDLKTQAEQP
jgi:hypothetical protein